MNIDYLRNFLTIVDEGNILAASKKLFIAQPSLSNQIKYLETLYGCKLIVRGGRKVSLTEQGKILYEYANKIIKDFETSQLLINEAKCGKMGKLSIAIPPTVYHDLLHKNFLNYINKYPDVHLEIFELSSAYAEKHVREGEIEIAITNATIHNLDEFEVRVLSTETFKVFVPKDNELFEKKEISIKDLKQQKLIVPRAYVGNISNYFNEAGLSMCLDSTTTTSLGSIEMAIMKDSLAIVPLPENEKINNDYNLKNLLVKHANIYTRKVIWSKNHSLSTAAKNFLDCIITEE